MITQDGVALGAGVATAVGAVVGNGVAVHAGMLVDVLVALGVEVAVTGSGVTVDGLAVRLASGVDDAAAVGMEVCRALAVAGVVGATVAVTAKDDVGMTRGAMGTMVERAAAVGVRAGSAALIGTGLISGVAATVEVGTAGVAAVAAGTGSEVATRAISEGIGGGGVASEVTGATNVGWAEAAGAVASPGGGVDARSPATTPAALAEPAAELIVTAVTWATGRLVVGAGRGVPIGRVLALAADCRAGVPSGGGGTSVGIGGRSGRAPLGAAGRAETPVRRFGAGVPRCPA